jgi:hypothetical protein
MNWLEAHLDELAQTTGWPYQPKSSAAVEPAALAALALEAHGRGDAAERARRWLTDHQARDGTLGVDDHNPAPHWPTALAILAWRLAPAREVVAKSSYSSAIERATKSILATAGQRLPRTVDLGHDTTLVGWNWAEGTHSWQEPTAMCVLALKATGNGNHPRAREGVRLLIDRLLPEGGCNYGNTILLGQTLKPHLEPTGLTLLALVGETDTSGRLKRSIAYARDATAKSRTAASLAFGLLGLAAHDAWPAAADVWLQETFERTHRGAFLPRRTLLTLASLGRSCPLITLTAR